MTGNGAKLPVSNIARDARLPFWQRELTVLLQQSVGYPAAADSRP
jgi:hypothetical protein